MSTREGPSVISIQMIEARYATLRALEEQCDDPRMHPSERTKAAARKQGGFEVPRDPKPVVMLDDIQHTEHACVCGEEDCICYQSELEARIAEREPTRRSGKTLFSGAYPTPPVGLDSPLNGNKPFNLMR